MTPEQYEDEQLLLQYLTIEETLYKAIQHLTNQEELLNYHMKRLESFPFLQSYHVENSRLVVLQYELKEAQHRLFIIEKNIMEDLKDGGWDFIKDSAAGFEFMQALYLQKTKGGE